MRLGKAFTVVTVDKEIECGEADKEDLRARYQNRSMPPEICI